MLIYTEDKKFTKEQVQSLFLSVQWISGNYPDLLYKALMNSSMVLTVWDDEKLVGLTRVLDDTEMLAQIHYVLVHPDYQGKGIAGNMLAYIKEKYKDFMYIEVMPEDKNNVPFYTKHGFSVMENGAAMQICNTTDVCTHLSFEEPTAIGGMSKAEIDLELQKGMDSLKSGKVYTADEVEAEFAREFGKR